MEKSAIGSFNFYPIMSSLGALWYTLGIKDMTDSDLKQITQKLNNLNVGINLTPKILREMAQDAVPKGVKIELDPKITQDGLTRAAEGKTMRVEVIPLLTQLRKALKDATAASPAEIEVGVQETKLRNIINNVLHRQGYMININTVDDNYTKVVQQKLNGRTYTVKIHADAKEITRSVQASLMQVQSRNFGLQVSKDILRKSIDDALLGKPFNIQIAVMHDQARRAVQNALNNARMVGKDDALAYQRLMTGELKAAQAELARLKAAHQGATSAANAHASASINLGGALGSNIKIAGELGAAMASLYSVHAAKQFLSQVIEIGGELEHQKIALETIYGTPSKMESLYGQIKGLARQSPFGVMELTKNVKQLSAYGVAYNEVYDTAKRLADISAATSVDIQRLILAFGKTKNRTFLDGLEAKQFAYANIPIYDMLSKKLTELEGKFVSVKDVMGRIKKREIGFDMVKEILWDMTDEGGKFYNMQEKLAGSVKTSWKLVRDNIELMFGEIAEGPVGSGLKSLGEVLQKLTREWKTIGSVLFSGVAVFGVYKTAVMATNAVLARHNVELLKSTAAQNKEILAKTVGATVYRKLSSEERRALNVKQGLAIANSKNIFSTKQLTMAQIASLHQEKAMTKDMALRLIATKRINAADIQYLVQQKIITQAEAQRALSVSGLAARFKLLGASIWSSVKAAAAFVFNPATLSMAALGAVITLWQRNSQEMEKNKEIGKGVFNKAVDSAKELKDMLASIGTSEGMSTLELSQGIEQMENKIKDLSPTPIEDINNSLVAQDGHVRTLTERFDFLKKRLEEVGQAYNIIISANLDNKIQGALDATDGSNWFTQLFNDDLITNATDYTNALKRREDAIASLIAKNKQAMVSGIDAAMNSVPAFKEATKNIETYDEKLKYLIEHYKELEPAAWAFDQATARFDDVKSLDKIGNFSQIQDAYDELLADTDRFIADLNARIKIDPNSEEQKLALTASLKHILDSMESAGDDAKAVIAKKWEEAWNIVLMEDKIGPAMSAKFKTMMEQSSEEGIETIRRKMVYEGFNSLDKDSKKKVKDMMENAKSIVMSELSLTNQQISEYLASHPLEQIIQLVYTTSNDAPSDLAKELVAKHGYPGLTNSTDRLVKQWTKSGKMYDSRNAAKESLQAVYSELEAAKKEGGEVQKKAQEAYDEVWQALQYLGWTDLEVKDQKSNKHTGSKSQKDEFAESLKQRFKDIKDAWSEFQKWTKTEGKEAAANRIADSGLFSTLSADQIPKTIEDYRALVKGLEDELRKAGVKGNTRESLLNDLLKQLLDIDKTVVDEQLKLALDKVSKEAERQITDWNLFDKIRKATGNQDLAMSIAFGLNADAETDYPTMIKEQLKKASDAAENALSKIKPKDGESPYKIQGYNYEKLKELYDARSTDEGMQAWMAVPEEIRKAWEKANSDIIKYFDQQKDAVAGVLSEYQTLQDKIDAINAKRKDDLEKISRRRRDEKGNELSEYIIADAAERKRLADLVNSKADWDIFRQSNDYLRFFSTIYSYTLSEAQNMGMLIEQYLNRQLQNAQISAEEYGKEMERVRGQIEKLRNVKSPFMTFFTDGANGYLDQRLNQLGDRIKADPKLSKELFDYRKKEQELTEQIAKAQKEGDKDRVNELKKELKLLRDGLSDAVKGFVVSDKFKNVLSDINKVVAGIDNVIKGVSDAFDSIREMADSFGFDTESNGWLDMGAVIDTFSQVSSALQAAVKGDIGGIISGVVSAVTSPFSIWNRLHDKKLDKMIEKSKEAAQIMQNQYDILEKQMANFLGNAAAMKTGVLGGGYGKQRQLMQGQLTELEKQRQAEIDKKKTDNSVVEDYNQQIEEMKIQIRDFALEVAKDLYGIDLNGWAEQLGDSLVDAFAAGEDAAEAFDKTVSDIMRDVTSKMISQDILAPMFGDLRNFLFGTDGMSGAFGADFKLDPSEMGAMKEYLDKIKYEGIPAAQDLFDAINNATGGLLNDTEKSKNGATAGLQSLTENTGDLLASYLNGVRGDVSVVRLDWDKLVENTLPEMNIIAEAQLTAQRQIAENTLRTAEAAEAINSAMATVTKNQDRLERSWRRIAEKNWGTY